MNSTKSKIRAAKATEVCTGLKLTDPALDALTPAMTPLDYLAALREAGLFADAVQFLARALPKREAVWWAATCARDLPPNEKRPEIGKCLDVAEGWVRRPTEDNRRAAEKAAGTVRDDQAAHWAALAAFWSGGSISAPGQPQVPAGENFTATAVTGGVMIAATAEAELFDARKEKFLDAGAEIANGGTGRPPQAAG